MLQSRPARGGLVLALTLVLSACGGATAPTTQPIAATPGTIATAVAPTPAASSPATSSSPTQAAVQGGRLAFGVRAIDGSSQVFSMLSDGSDVRQLTTGAGNHLCASYSADGRRVAYCGDASGSFELWTMLPDGTEQAQLTHLGGRALFSDFAPDGTKVAFGGIEGDDASMEIYTVDATTGAGPVALTSCAKLGANCSNDYPAYSPNGREIVFIHTDGVDAKNPGIGQVWVMNADGSHAHALTTDKLPKDQVPNWSPDGSTIVYSRGTSDNEGIWTMAKDGSGQHQLTGCRTGDPSPCAAGDDFGPVWSPDGKQIAFLRAFGAVGANDRPIFVMQADGTAQHRLVPGVILQAVPSWQATGVAAGG